MHFIPSEKKLRHKFIDQSIDGLNTILDNVNPESTPIEKSRLKIYRDIISKLVIVNVNHGIASAPRSKTIRNENYIPIWAMPPGEEVFLYMDDRHASPEQQQIIDSHVDYSKWRDIVEPFLNKYWTVDSVSLGENTLGLTSHTSAFIGAETFPLANMIESRPFVVLNTKDMTAEGYISSTLAHELEHVNQVTSQPHSFVASVGQKNDVLLARELMAYRAGAKLNFEAKEQHRMQKIDKPVHTGDYASEMVYYLTTDATFDPDGYIELGNGYRRKLVDRLAKKSLGSIAPELDMSAEQRARTIF